MSAKSMFYEISRWAAVLAAVISLFVMFGGNTASTAQPEAVAEAVTQTIDMTNMVEADNQMVKRLYGLDPASFEGCILYYPTTNMMAEELLIIKLSDMSQQEAVRTAVEARLQTQKNTFEGYGVEQFDMLTNHSILDIRGNYVLFVVNTNCDAALTAFRGAL